MPGCLSAPLVYLVVVSLSAPTVGKVRPFPVLGTWSDALATGAQASSWRPGPHCSAHSLRVGGSGEGALRLGVSRSLLGFRLASPLHRPWWGFWVSCCIWTCGEHRPSAAFAFRSLSVGACVLSQHHAHLRAALHHLLRSGGAGLLGEGKRCPALFWGELENWPRSFKRPVELSIKPPGPGLLVGTGPLSWGCGSAHTSCCSLVRSLTLLGPGRGAGSAQVRAQPPGALCPCLQKQRCGRHGLLWF